MSPAAKTLSAGHPARSAENSTIPLRTSSRARRTAALLVFTRYPSPGRAKTRLIPRMGANGAAQLQRAMTEHILSRALPYVVRRGVTLEIRHAGAAPGDMRRWLGPGLPCAPQGEGDLGERMQRAFASHFAQDAAAVVAVGADCPGVNEAILSQAFAALQTHPVVFGPALDGGYYLVGMRRLVPELFQNIAWGASQVLAQSVAAARNFAGEPALLPPLRDVDHPEDLPVWEQSHRAMQSVSVVIPAFNEGNQIEATLRRMVAARPKEIFVVDGGSTDDTARIAAATGATVLSSPPGRARQMNTGAAAASGAVLLFLHADTWPPEDCVRLAAQALAKNGAVAGAFTFGLKEPMRGGRLVEWLTNARCRWAQLPYGDQGLFLRRELFDALGGFPDWPVLEDVELLRRLKRHGRVVTLPPRALTSARRWQAGGVMRTFCRHQLILLGYAAGVSPHVLAQIRR